ncbi:MAG: acylphosphatase [Candidatus Aenigmatarchaeota archaeon]
MPAVVARLVISGNVQAVAYRAAVKYLARTLGIDGFVRNLEDGTVEVFCKADKEKIEKFAGQLKIRSEGHGLFGICVDVKDVGIYYEGQEGFAEPGKPLGAFAIDYGEEAKTKFEGTNLERLEMASLLAMDLGHEMHGFRKETIDNFALMAKTYGEISQKMENGMQEVGKSIRESNENLAGLIKVLVKEIQRSKR